MMFIADSAMMASPRELAFLHSPASAAPAAIVPDATSAAPAAAGSCRNNRSPMMMRKSDGKATTSPRVESTSQVFDAKSGTGMPGVTASINDNMH